MNLLERIGLYQTMWTTLLPHITMPTPQDAARWAAYPTKAVEDALLRTAKRFSPGRLTNDFEPAQAYRYATAVARSISEHQELRERLRTV